MRFLEENIGKMLQTIGVGNDFKGVCVCVCVCACEHAHVLAHTSKGEYNWFFPSNIWMAGIEFRSLATGIFTCWAILLVQFL